MITAKIDDFILAALWSSVVVDEEGNNESCDCIDADLSDESREILSEMLNDFVEMANKELSALGLEYPLSDEQFAHDFWLTKEGHGAGFWDRGIGAVGDVLTDLSKQYGGTDFYINEQGELSCE